MGHKGHKSFEAIGAAAGGVDLSAVAVFFRTTLAIVA
jgi:hypothetical protein